MDFNTILTLISSKTAFHPKQSGDSYICRCPAHPDNRPSLSVTKNAESNTLFKCFAGCTTQDICTAIGIDIKDLFQEDLPVAQKADGKVVTREVRYEYTDEQGNIEFTKVRKANKKFLFERTDSDGKTQYNNKGCRQLLYKLPLVIQAISDNKAVYLVEGEKDADNLIAYGLIATTAPTSLKWAPEHTDFLRKAHVVLLYDYDKTGVKRRDTICDALYGQVKSLRVIDLPGLELKDEHGQDITDWLHFGNSIKQLRQLVKNCHAFNPAMRNNPIKTVSMKELLYMKIPERKMLMEPFLPAQGLALLYAYRGVGKTHVALGIAYAIAAGTRFLYWNAPQPQRVLYIDGEMPASQMQKRLLSIVMSNDKTPEEDYLTIITPDIQEEPIPDLSTNKGRMFLEPYLQKHTLIIIDNISTLFRSTVENEAEGWNTIQQWALSLRKRGKTVLFIHHAGKGGQQRGTSKREDALDTVIKLSRPPDYRPDDGARFEVHFEKARNFHGADAMPFEVKLNIDETGCQYWRLSDIQPLIERK